jgi:uncharacterized protein YyaL (SSP411 family)
MTISGLISCYKAFGEDHYLELALSNARFLSEKMMDSEGQIYHSYKNNQAKIPGFLEDYAFIIEAFTAIFEVTGEKKWLDLAEKLIRKTFQDFYDEQKTIFYFTAKGQNELITRTIEVYDNVIPSSNSVMAKNLFRLSWLLNRPNFLDISQKMLAQVTDSIINYPSGYSNWLQLLLNLSGEHYEVAIVGENAFDMLKKIQQYYLPHVVFCAGKTENGLPLLKNRFSAGKTLIYICQNQSCRLPVETAEEAVSLLNIR